MFIRTQMQVQRHIIYKGTQILKHRQKEKQHDTDRCTVYTHGREQVKQPKKRPRTQSISDPTVS